MTSYHEYSPNELPTSYLSGGIEWLASRLRLAGYHNVRVSLTSGGKVSFEVAEENVSKDQLAFDVQPPAGQLTCNYTELNVPPMSTRTITITGPIGTPVKVRFLGVGFVSETEFTIPGNNNYEFMLGACPAGQRVVTPQMFEFYVEDGSCSPVAVMVTFS